MYHLTGIRRTFLRVPPVWRCSRSRSAYLYTSAGTWLLAELAAPTEQLMVWICISVVLQLFYRSSAGRAARSRP